MSDLVSSIYNDMLFVSYEANPNNFKTEGIVGFKDFVNAEYGDIDDVEDIWDDFATLEYDVLEDYYINNKPVNFWVYDRKYNNESEIIYTLYDELGFGTHELLVDNIYDF